MDEHAAEADGLAIEAEIQAKKRMDDNAREPQAPRGGMQ